MTGATRGSTWAVLMTRAGISAQARRDRRVRRSRKHRASRIRTPAVTIDVGPSIPAGTLLATGVVAGVVTTLACWWGGAAPWNLLALGVALIATLVAPRSPGLVAWFALVGLALVLSDGAAGTLRPLWVVATIASAHLALACVRLTADLGARARVSRVALRISARSLVRPQLATQALGVVAWWPFGVQQPWLTAVALVGAAGLAWLVLGSRAGDPAT